MADGKTVTVSRLRWEALQAVATEASSLRITAHLVLPDGTEVVKTEGASRPLEERVKALSRALGALERIEAAEERG